MKMIDFKQLQEAKLKINLDSKIFKLEAGECVRGFVVGYRKLKGSENFGSMVEFLTEIDNVPTIVLLSNSVKLKSQLETIKASENYAVDGKISNYIPLEIMNKGELTAKNGVKYIDISVSTLDINVNSNEIDMQLSTNTQVMIEQKVYEEDVDVEPEEKHYPNA